MTPSAPDPRRPLVRCDERPVVLRADAHPGPPCAPGAPARTDDEYPDFAHAVRHLVDEVHPTRW